MAAAIKRKLSLLPEELLKSVITSPNSAFVVIEERVIPRTAGQCIGRVAANQNIATLAARKIILAVVTEQRIANHHRRRKYPGHECRGFFRYW